MGKGDHSRFPATDLGMRLRGSHHRSSKKDVGSPLVLLVPWEERLLWMPAGVGVWEKTSSWGGRLGEDGL